MHLFRALALTVSALIATAFGVTTGTAAAASTITIGGVIHCHGGAVEGIWVASTGPGSGWAERWNFSPSDSADNTWHFVLPATAGQQISLHVGCGGSPSAWATSNTSPYRPVSTSRTLNLLCGNGAANGPCNYASWPAPAKLSYNPAGSANQCQCTYYAMQQWYAYENPGWYPDISGNAYQWPASAQANGWTVTTVPMRYSFVVFPQNRSSSDGHVAWVTALIQDASTQEVVGLKIDEGNVHGLNQCGDDLTNESVYFANPAPRFGSPSTWEYIPAS